MTLTGALAHAVDLHHWNVETVKELQRLFHHRRCRRHEQLTAIQAESATDRTEYQPVSQRPAVRQAASEQHRCLVGQQPQCNMLPYGYSYKASCAREFPLKDLQLLISTIGKNHTRQF